MKRNPITEAVLAMLDEHRASYEWMDGAKHNKIAVFYNGQKRIYTWSRTASDHRAEKNAVKYLKHLLQEMQCTSQSSGYGSRMGICK